ncbi:MAG: hypothetical protein ACOVOG_15925, partial [Rubrivivax sp.]
GSLPDRGKPDGAAAPVSCIVANERSAGRHGPLTMLCQPCGNPGDASTRGQAMHTPPKAL